MSLTKNSEQENSNTLLMMKMQEVNSVEEEEDKNYWADLERQAALYDQTEGAVNDPEVELAFDRVMENRLKNKLKLYEERQKAFEKIMTIKIDSRDDNNNKNIKNELDGWSQELYNAICEFKSADAALNKKV